MWFDAILDIQTNVSVGQLCSLIFFPAPCTRRPKVEQTVCLIGHWSYQKGIRQVFFIKQWRGGPHGQFIASVPVQYSFENG